MDEHPGDTPVEPDDVHPGDPAGMPSPPEPPPTLPGRGAYLTVFVAITVAGLFGGIIGWGITDLGCTGDCTLAVTIGTLVGAIGAASGVGIIGVLVLRAMAEWKPRDRDVQPERASRRKPSA